MNALAQITAPFFARQNIQEIAFAVARKVDEHIARDTDGQYDETWLAIGEINGGLSNDGVYADLVASLATVEELIMCDASPWDYSRGMGAGDPDHYISGRLEDQINAACDETCQRFVTAVRVLMAAIGVSV